MTGRANRCHQAKRSDSLFLKNVSTTKLRCSADQPMASSENGKTAANQRDHSHHCIPSTARAVTPPKVGVISGTPCMFCGFIQHNKGVPPEREFLVLLVRYYISFGTSPSTGHIIKPKISKPVNKICLSVSCASSKEGPSILKSSIRCLSLDSHSQNRIGTPVTTHT